MSDEKRTEFGNGGDLEGVRGELEGDPRALPTHPNHPRPYYDTWGIGSGAIVRAGAAWGGVWTLGSPSEDHTRAFPRPHKCQGESPQRRAKQDTIRGMERNLGDRVACPGLPARKALPIIVLALLASLVFFLFPSTTPAHASTSNTGSGRISGQLVDGTNKNVVVAGQKVILQMAQGNTASDLTSVTTDAHGSFAFNGLDISKTINYAVYTNYEGAQYFTDLIDLSSGAVQQVNLTVYEATTSTANIAVVRATLLLQEPDAQKGGFTVSEIYVFKNLGTTTYVGSLTANGNNALRFSLPRNARKVSLGSGFNGYQGMPVDQGFATDAAVLPGDSEFDFSFEVPYTTSLYDFNYNVIYPTVQLSLFVPQDIHASSSGLNSGGLVSADKHPYHLFEAQVLAPGVQLHAELEGLPVSSSAANSSSLDSPAVWVWVVAALLGMLAIVGITWLFYRSMRRSASRRQVRRDAAQGNRDKSISIKKDADQQVQDGQEALLQGLLDLDKTFEAGKIKKTEYQERRAKTKARLRRLMSEEMVAEAAKTAKGKGVS